VTGGDRPPLPRSLQLEVTAACNLRCHMCLVRYRPPLNRVEGAMSLEDFRVLLDQLPAVDDLTLQGLGEPLLAPDLVRMVRHASERGIRVGFNTNATLLTGDVAESLLAAGLDWLCVSVDGASAGVYEAVRDGARFERVSRNVRGLLQLRRRRGASRPHVSLVFVAMRRNVGELPALVRMAADWGVDRVSVQNLSHSFSDTDPHGRYREIRDYTAREALWQGADEEAAAAFAEAEAEAARLGMALHLPSLEERPAPRRPGTPGCDWPWRAAYVEHDGTVQPCCMVMGSDRAAMGSVREEGFQAIWHGARFAAFRRALLGSRPPAVCRGCSLYRGVF
jgi:radical SAM protein with 4Fe4S-binding SPASM domain